MAAAFASGKYRFTPWSRVAADGAPEEALSEETIAQVWGVRARWLGVPGARALVAG